MVRLRSGMLCVAECCAWSLAVGVAAKQTASEQTLANKPLHSEPRVARLDEVIVVRRGPVNAVVELNRFVARRVMYVRTLGCVRRIAIHEVECLARICSCAADIAS